MRALAVLAVLSLVAAPAMAAPITYNFSSTVNQVGTRTLVPVTVGQVLPIVITVDGAFPQTSPGSGVYA